MIAKEMLLPPDIRVMLAGIERAPEDLVQYGALADCLEENYACEPPLLYALRWMERRKHCPHKRLNYINLAGDVTRRVPSKFAWAWYRPGYTPYPRDRGYGTGSARLPKAVMPACHENREYFPSALAAIIALAKWLEDIRIGYSLEIPS